ncbi:MAG: extracellular solute-binding protein [Oscillospiraceae bacterium]|nr:extracellular solute-binding protein [Oscillospiraceae bacterium]
MKKINKIVTLMLVLFIVMSCTGCKESVKIESRKINKSVTAEDYSMESFDLSDHFLELFDAVGCSEGIDVIGYNYERAADFSEISIKDKTKINSMTIKNDYSYEPNFYYDGVFYSNGFNYYDGCPSIEERNKNIIIDHTVSTYIDKEKNIYRVGYTKNNSPVISIDNKDNENILTKSISEITGMDSNDFFVNDIAVQNDSIYIACNKTDISSQTKSYVPFVFILDLNCSLQQKIEDMDIDFIDRMVVSNNTVYISHYDDLSNMSCIYPIDLISKTRSQQLNLDGNVKIFSSSEDNVIYYYDGIKTLYRYNISTADETVIYEFSDNGDVMSDEDTFSVVSCNDESFSYMKTKNAQSYSTFTIDKDGNVDRSENNNDYYILTSTDDIEYSTIQNINGDISIVLENSYPLDSNLYYDDSRYYVAYRNSVDIYDNTGKCLNTYETKYKEIMGVYIYDKHQYVIGKDDKDQYFVSVLNENSSAIKEICNLNDSITDINYNQPLFFRGDERNVFYIKSNGILYGFDLNDSVPIPLVNVASNGISIDYVFSIDEKYYILSDTTLNILSPCEKNDNDAKKDEVNFMVQPGHAEILKPVVDKFNSGNNDIKVNMSCYSEDVKTGITSLEKDYVEGTQPDMIISGMYTDITDLERKGAFTDLQGLLNSSQNYNPDDYMTNIFDSYRNSGKLCRIPLTFYLKTLVLESNDSVKINNNWNYKEFADICNTDTTLFSDKTKSIITGMFNLDINPDFIDYNSNKSYYDSPSFIDLIDTINNYGVDDNGDIDEYYSTDNLCTDTTIRSDSMITYYGKQFIGIPSDCGRGSYICSDMLASISEKSSMKEACLKFLLFLLDNENQQDLCFYGPTFSVRKEEVESVLESIKFDTDESYVQSCRDLLTKENAAYIKNRYIYDVIDEELNCFYAKGQSAQEAAANIQRKVSLYLDEIK